MSFLGEKGPVDVVVLWDKVLESLRATTSEMAFNALFPLMRPLSFDGERLVVQADSPLVMDWLKQKHAVAIEALLLDLCGTPARLVVHHNENAPPPLPLPAPPLVRAAPVPALVPSSRPRVCSSSLNPAWTFLNFIVGTSNQMAHAAAFAAAQKPGSAYNPLFIYGSVGLGKTHLMQAIGNSILAHDPSKNVCFISCERFMNQFIDAIQNRTMAKFREFFRSNVDVLLVDDIQFLARGEATQEEFYHMFNDLHNQNKQIVMTSDKSPQELQHMENRIINRFEWGMVADIQSPDFDTRVAIIHKKLEQYGQSLNDDLVFYLANKVRNDVRKIEGALIRLLGLTSLQNKPLTVETAKECLKDFVTSHTVNLETIQKTVADFFDLRITDLKSNRRPKSISHPRQLAMFLCRDLTNSSLSDIAQSFGGKDHTTVLYACKKVSSLKANDDALADQLNALKKRILETSWSL